MENKDDKIDSVTIAANGEPGVTLTGEQFAKLAGVAAKNVDKGPLVIPEELLDSKEFKKLKKQMGEPNCREFFQKTDEQLRATIAECEVQMEEATRETNANVEFKRASGIINDFKSALRDACNPLNTTQRAAAMIVSYRNELKKLARKA